MERKFNPYVPHPLTLNPSKFNLVGTVRGPRAFWTLCNKPLEAVFSLNLRKYSENLFSMTLVRGVRQDFDFALRFHNSQQIPTLVRSIAILYIQFLPITWDTGTTILWKVEKYGLRSNSTMCWALCGAQALGPSALISAFLSSGSLRGSLPLCYSVTVLEVLFSCKDWWRMVEERKMLGNRIPNRQTEPDNLNTDGTDYGDICGIWSKFTQSVCVNEHP